MSEKEGSASGSRVLIAFATTYGQTEKIARVIADRLSARGETVQLRRCAELVDTKLDDFDAVIVGGSIIGQRPRPAVRRFVAGHREALREKPSAFFQVSGAAGSRLESEREAARAIMNSFLDRTGWSPAERASFGGAITYTKYPLVLKWIMKWISSRNGGSTDTSRDHEYTDWDEVATFADRVGTRLDRAHATESSATT